MGMTALDILINCYQGALMVFFMKRRLVQQIRRSWLDCCAMLMVGALLCLLEFTGIGISDNIIFLIPFVYALITTRWQWFPCLLWTAVLLGLFLTTTMLVGDVLSSAINGSWTELLQDDSVRAVFLVSCNIALTAVIVAAAHVGTRSAYVSRASICCFLALLLTEMITGELLYITKLRMPGQYPYFTAISLLLFASMLLTVLLFEWTNRQALRQKQTELSLQIAQQNQTHQEELRTIYGNMLAAQHDLRHRITAAEQLLRNHGTDAEHEAADLLKGTDVLPEYITGNMAMDAILTAKAATMKRAGIDFQFIPYPLQRLPISETDFCILISNLLDNAIEGVMRLPASAESRKVRLALSQAWDMFSIHCENDMEAKSIHRQGDKFLSSKADAAIHGFGTESIKRIVEEAGGWVCFDTDHHRFSVDILLPTEA